MLSTEKIRWILVSFAFAFQANFSSISWASRFEIAGSMPFGVQDTLNVYFHLSCIRTGSKFGLARCAGAACNSLGPRRWSYWSRLVFRPPGFFRINTKTRGGAARLPQPTTSPVLRGKQMEVESKRDVEEINKVVPGARLLTFYWIMCVYRQNVSVIIPVYITCRHPGQ